jgi:hypothetical protein
MHRIYATAVRVRKLHITFKRGNKMSRKIQIALAVSTMLVVTAALIFWLGRQDVTHSSVSEKNPPTQSAKTVVTDTNADHLKTSGSYLPTYPNLTYRPAQPRAVKQYQGPVGDFGRPLHWWLYARSDQEVVWLDQYGFPTPAEEVRLRASSDAELASLAAQGDKNAKAHVVARSIKTTVEKQETTNAESVRNQMSILLAHGGPYQATTLLDALGNSLANYARLPEKEQTDERRQILSQYSDLIPTLMFVGEVYGDYALLSIYNDIPALAARRALGFDDKPKISAGSLASLISSNARDRVALGEPPLTITTRPLPTLGSEGRFSSEPGAIILERK